MDIVVFTVARAQFRGCGQRRSESVVVNIFRLYRQSDISFGILHQRNACQIGDSRSSAVAGSPYLDCFSFKDALVFSDILFCKIQYDVAACFESGMESGLSYIKVSPPFCFITGASRHDGKQYGFAVQFLVGCCRAHRIHLHLFFVVLVDLNVFEADLIQEVPEIAALIRVVHIHAAYGR